MKMENLNVELNRNKIIDFFDFFINGLYFYVFSLAITVSNLTGRFFEHYQINEILDLISEKLEDHPVLKFVIIGAAITCTIPIILFVMFAVVSLIITFAGFLLIEGIILAMGGLCVFIYLMSIIMIFSVLAMAFGTAYIIAKKLQMY